MDCTWEKPVNPVEMEEKIDGITGVVEVGFFTKIRHKEFIAHADGSVASDLTPDRTLLR